jgi:hypothetical protein
MPHPFFDVNTFPWDREDAKKLRGLLEELYTDVPEIKDVYVECGGAEIEVEWGQKAKLVWGEVLKELCAKQRLRKLCDVVEGDHPDAENVKVIITKIRAAKPDSSDPSPPGPVPASFQVSLVHLSADKTMKERQTGIIFSHGQGTSKNPYYYILTAGHADIAKLKTVNFWCETGAYDGTGGGFIAERCLDLPFESFGRTLLYNESWKDWSASLRLTGLLLFRVADDNFRPPPGRSPAPFDSVFFVAPYPTFDGRVHGCPRVEIGGVVTRASWDFTNGKEAVAFAAVWQWDWGGNYMPEISGAMSGGGVQIQAHDKIAGVFLTTVKLDDKDRGIGIRADGVKEILELYERKSKGPLALLQRLFLGDPDGAELRPERLSDWILRRFLG